MAGLVLNIRKSTNSDNSKPYATVYFLNIQQSDLEIDNKQLKDNNIYKCSYDLSLIYPELNDENGRFDFEKAYSIFTTEMFGIQEDVKCIDIPLSEVCNHNELIKRSGGFMIRNIYIAYYNNYNRVKENVKNYVIKQLKQKDWIIPDESFYKFIIDSKEHYIKLSNKTCVNYNTYIAKVATGPYAKNSFHNYQYGIFYQNKINNTNNILIPFVYDYIKICRMKHDFIQYYFAVMIDDDEDEKLYNIYTQSLDDYETNDLLPCIVREVDIVMIDKKLRYIIFRHKGKNGVIRNGEVFIKAQFSSISAYRLHLDMIYEDNEEENKIIFIVYSERKQGLFFEDKMILPTIYDSICVMDELGTCSLIKDKQYYIGNFNRKNYEFTIKEISEEDYYDYFEEDNDDSFNQYCSEEWTEEDAWIALTDGQYGEYPQDSSIDWDYLDDIQGI